MARHPLALGPLALGPLALGVLALSVCGCGGAAPLMHTAHPLRENEVTMGAGFSGALRLPDDRSSATTTEEALIEEAAFSPGLAPWVGGRLGIDGRWDAGLTYTARTVRVDIRRAFDLDGPAFSVGLGASGILPKRRDDLGLRVGGFGGDVPILFGLRSDADIYALWIGARGGAELLRGQVEVAEDPLDPTILPPIELEGWHAQAGGLLGFRVGFRYIYAVFEVGVAMHWAEGQIGDTEVSYEQLGLSPSGALLGSF